MPVGRDACNLRSRARGKRAPGAACALQPARSPPGALRPASLPPRAPLSTGTPAARTPSLAPQGAAPPRPATLTLNPAQVLPLVAAHVSAAGRAAEDWAAQAGSPPAQGASPGAAGGPARGLAEPAGHANGRPAPVGDGAAESGEAAEDHASDEAGWTSEDEEDADDNEADGAEAGEVGDGVEDEDEADDVDEELVPEARWARRHPASSRAHPATGAVQPCIWNDPLRQCELASLVRAGTRVSRAGAWLGLSDAAPCGRGGRRSRVRGRRRVKPSAVDDEDEEDEDEDDDVEPGYVRAVMDGWLTLRLPERALSPLLCLRGRLTACFAAKARPRTPCAPTRPARAARAHGGAASVARRCLHVPPRPAAGAAGLQLCACLPPGRGLRSHARSSAAAVSWHRLLPVSSNRAGRSCTQAC